jgi:hypothetical protein
MKPTRAEINRANARHSTGPRTATGKARSSQNSFKHGLYAKYLVLPDEDPAELDELCASSRKIVASFLQILLWWGRQSLLSANKMMAPAAERTG